MTSITVRRVDSNETESFIAKLSELSEKAFSKSLWKDPRPHLPIVQSLVQSENAQLWIAENEGILFGFTLGEVLCKDSFLRVDDTGTVPLREGDYLLSWTAVDPAYQGKKVASLLFAYRMAAALKHSRILAVTRLNNFKMTRLYRSSGLELYRTINRLDIVGKPCAFSWFIRVNCSL